MRAKGWRRVEDPEKMPVITSGLRMTRKTSATDAEARERLTGGNAPADEALTSKLVVDYILGTSENA